MPFHTNHYYATEFCKHQQQYTFSSVDLYASYELRCTLWFKMGFDLTSRCQLFSENKIYTSSPSFSFNQTYVNKVVLNKMVLQCFPTLIKMYRLDVIFRI